jgi:hypothetical protein
VDNDHYDYYHQHQKESLNLKDSLDTWTFADEFRATVKTSTNVTNERPILTGMAIGLNSTLSIAEGMLL